jgi:hypothetical protein
VSDRPVKVVLDASAIVPIFCLVEAARAVADGDHLELLVNHPPPLC